MKSYDKETETSEGTKKVSDAKLKNLLKANPIGETELSDISES